MSRDLIERLRTGEWWRAVVQGCNPTSFSTDETATAREAADRIAALEAEALETARLLGMGGEREANLHGEVTRLKKALARAEAEASEGEREHHANEARLARLMGVLRRIKWNRHRRPELSDGGTEAAFEDIFDMMFSDALDAALIPEAPAREGWRPIETAPRDGTVVDLWHEDFGRQADFKWGHTEHSCGEAGQYCDSDWHSEEAGWVDTTLNERFFTEDAFTHWRPLPPPPSQDREPYSQRGAK